MEYIALNIERRCLCARNTIVGNDGDGGDDNDCNYFETLLLPTDAHNVKKHRVTKTF